MLALLGAVLAVIALAALLAPGGVHGADETLAASDDVVLAHVPARGSAAGQELAALQERHKAAPHELVRTLDLARAYIEASRETGDPRPLGYAESVLLSSLSPVPLGERQGRSPYHARPQSDQRAQEKPPHRTHEQQAPLLVLLATVEQSRHAFDAALAHLRTALDAAPHDPQAWLTQASILTVRGRYSEARASCSALAALTTPFVATACVAPIDALTGHAEQAMRALSEALPGLSSPAEQAWAHSLLGELAFWTGEPAAAESHLRAALALDATDRYARGLLADVLLDADRAQEALTLVQGRTDDDAMLLRQALASLALARPDAHSLVTKLEQRFADSRLRSDFVHQREEARIMLASSSDARRALASARQSFAAQREPWDARLVLEAALKSRNRAAAAPALAWLDETGFQAPALLALAEQLRSL